MPTIVDIKTKISHQFINLKDSQLHLKPASPTPEYFSHTPVRRLNSNLALAKAGITGFYGNKPLNTTRVLFDDGNHVDLIRKQELELTSPNGAIITIRRQQTRA